MTNAVKIIQIDAKKAKATGRVFDIVTFSDGTEAFYNRDLTGVEVGALGIPELDSTKSGGLALKGWTKTGMEEPPPPPDWDAKDRGKTMGGVTHGAVGQIVGAMISAGLLKKDADIEAATEAIAIRLYGLAMQASKNHIAYPGFDPRES